MQPHGVPVQNILDLREAALAQGRDRFPCTGSLPEPLGSGGVGSGAPGGAAARVVGLWGVCSVCCLGLPVSPVGLLLARRSGWCWALALPGIPPAWFTPCWGQAPFTPQWARSRYPPRSPGPAGGSRHRGWSCSQPRMGVAWTGQLGATSWLWDSVRVSVRVVAEGTQMGTRPWTRPGLYAGPTLVGQRWAGQGADPCGVVCPTGGGEAPGGHLGAPAAWGAPCGLQQGAEALGAGLAFPHPVLRQVASGGESTSTVGDAPAAPVVTGESWRLAEEERLSLITAPPTGHSLGLAATRTGRSCHWVD